MSEYTPDRYEIFMKEPESMCVGRLNNVVRELREALYQERLKGQDARAALLDALPFVLPEAARGPALEEWRKMAEKVLTIFPKGGVNSVDEALRSLRRLLEAK